MWRLKKAWSPCGFPPPNKPHGFTRINQRPLIYGSRFCVTFIRIHPFSSARVGAGGGGKSFGNGFGLGGWERGAIYEAGLSDGEARTGEDGAGVTVPVQSQRRGTGGSCRARDVEFEALSAFDIRREWEKSNL